MGKPTGFKEFERREHGYRPVAERLSSYKEFSVPLKKSELSEQGARCMDCGIPFCHNGCPVNNIIPDWNDLVYRNRWREALEVLQSTNNFPEVTGRICPAPCEAACTLNIQDTPVSIKDIELAIVERGWEEGWIAVDSSKPSTGKKVAVIGSGPSGLAAAQQLARVGHSVTVFEKNAKAGGLMRYGIPDFKLDKAVIDRRIAQMASEGVTFRTNVHVGVSLDASNLLGEFDAILLTGGSEQPRDLPIPGRDLGGVHFAMEFLGQSNRRVSGEKWDGPEIVATGKHVVVIGGGDTGSDCVGTSNRQGAASVTQIEIMPKPPIKENKALTWPQWPLKLRSSTSHEEGCDRRWGVTATEFEGQGGKVVGLRGAAVDAKLKPLAGTEFVLKADLVLLAMGFLHPVKTGLLEQLAVAHDPRGNVLADVQSYRSSVDKVFAAGDMRRGQSLVVWAIREGRQAARAVDEFLMGKSDLPR
ncbi:glutamate synthase subunit beta [Telmatospirillum sp.]|uniref:glutamate synthase subunit beta n=1 Tax=Telmatospirillum sp. TaxID=2079197 RepID=UPI002847AE83|nr:glutamate synthase subunit beta [Telmatospirillum sp.]MDR3436889.1 glutamate synthase subunit beta [Telmatospirillum sp.]